MDAPPIRRTRSGCTTCVKRKRKCDEMLPRCSACARLNQDCDRSRNFRFKHVSVSDMLNPQSRSNKTTEDAGSCLPAETDSGDPVEALSSPAGRAEAPFATSPQRGLSPHNSSVMDGLRTRRAGNPTGAQSSVSSNARSVLALMPIDSDPSSSDASCDTQRSWHASFPPHVSPLATASTPSDFQVTRSLSVAEVESDARVLEEDDTRLVATSVHTASEMTAYDLESNFISVFEGLDYLFPDESQEGSPHTPRPEPFTSAIDIELLKVYLVETGPWIEACDSARHFTVVELQHMIVCPPFRSAALALASKFKECTDPTYPAHRSLHLCQKAVRELIRCLPADDYTGVLAAAVLLFVYELVTVSLVDWRRHLQGCASLFASRGWNGSTGGLVGSCFWAYVRSDIWAAFCSDSVTIIPPDEWYDDNVSMLDQKNQSPDDHVHTMLWLFAQVINFLARRASMDETTKRREWEELFDRLTLWTTLGSAQTKPVVDIDLHEDRDNANQRGTAADCFPTIIFSNNSSIIAWYQYHTALVLLLEVADSPRYDGSIVSDMIINHARRTCGIVQSNPTSPCLVNAIQPIWICGRNLRSADEKFTALNMLSQIQKQTGWKCGWRSKSLRDHWNLV